MPTVAAAARRQIAGLNAELAAANEGLRRANAELERRVADRTHALLVTLGQLERRGREQTLALAAEQELGELKSRFVSMASHEFRTPLTVVLSSAQLIAKYPQHAQQPLRLRHLARIRAAVRQLNATLEEFLSVGGLDEGRVEAHPALLDVGALLAEVVADMRPQLRAGQRIEPLVDCPAPLRLDGSLLRKILVNLLANASKFSPENTPIGLQATGRGGRLAVVVQDRGAGIAPADQAHLFERFFRAAAAAAVPGTGLGLYIVARYLDLMGGTIQLTSTLGEGTRVTLSIPVAPE